MIATHLYGGMVDMPRLVKLCRDAGVTLIEDCAQVHCAAMAGDERSLVPTPQESVTVASFAPAWTTFPPKTSWPTCMSYAPKTATT